MAIYKVQGPAGEIIEIEGPDNADPNLVIQQAQSLYKPKEKGAADYAKDFGKATASLADVGINAVTGGLDYAAYNLARAAGLSPERAMQETTSPKDIIGRAFDITKDPAYQSEASRRLMTGVGQGVEQYAVKPLASMTGLPEQDVSSMVGSGMMLAGAKAQPYINRAGQSVAQSMFAAEPVVAGMAKTAAKAPYQFGKGLVEGLVNKEYNQPTSAMIPLRETYTPQAAAERFMGQMPNVPPQTLSQLESQARPTSELVGGRAGQIAQAISPKTPAGETLVPLQGQGMQAWGERVGRGVRTNPGQALIEAGVTALTGIPFKTLSQGAGELGARYLGAKTGFMPGFSEKLGQAQGRAGFEGQMPQTPLLTNQPTVKGPVAPAPMYVSPEGVAGTNINQVSQAGAMSKYPQMTPQQMAVAKTQEIVTGKAVAPVAPTTVAPTTVAPKIVTKPAQQTVRPSKVINNEMTLLDNELTSLRDEALSARVKPNTPEGNQYQQQAAAISTKINTLQKELELAKQAEKQLAKKKAPSNVSQMLTEDTIFNTKQEWEKANLFNKLANKKAVGGYREGSNIVREERFDYGNMPEDLRKNIPEISIVKRTLKGKRIE